MPIPTGAKTVSGSPNRVTLSNGSTVTRAQALTLGAKERGYSSHYSYRSHAASDKKYFDAWKNTPHGREVIAKEKSLAANEGRRYSPSEMQQRLISARNDRPHGDRFRTGPGAQGGPAFFDFLDRYDIDDDRDIYY